MLLGMFATKIEEERVDICAHTSDLLFVHVLNINSIESTEQTWVEWEGGIVFTIYEDMIIGTFWKAIFSGIFEG